MDIINFNEFVKYSKFVNSQIITNKIYESSNPNEPNDATKKKIARTKVEYAGQVLPTKFPFFAEILFNQQIIYTYDSRIPTAATDGHRIFINPNFFYPMSTRQVLFVLAHEVMHTALLHTVRQYSRDHNRWNIAADHEINLLLAYDKILSIEEITNELHGYANPEYKGQTAEEIYNDPDLQVGNKPSSGEPESDGNSMPEDEVPSNGESGSGGDPAPGGESENGESGSGGDPAPGRESENGEPGSGGDPAPGGESESDRPSDIDKETNDSEHPITEIRGPKTGEVITREEGDAIARREGIDVDGDSSLPAKNEDLLKREIREAAQRHLTNRSSTAGRGNNGSLYQRIMQLTEPKINWKQVLSKYIGKLASSSEFKMPNRRFVSRGEYRHGLVDEFSMLERAAIVFDVSGSIANEFPIIAAEVTGIVKSKKVKRIHIVPFADSVVTPFEIKGSKKPTPEDFAKVATGGGTSGFNAVVDYINEKTRKNPDFVVIITDGYLYGDFPPKITPKWSKKVIWLIFDNPNFNPGNNWGKVIHANQDNGFYNK